MVSRRRVFGIGISLLRCGAGHREGRGVRNIVSFETKKPRCINTEATSGARASSSLADVFLGRFGGRRSLAAHISFVVRSLVVRVEEMHAEPLRPRRGPGSGGAERSSSFSSCQSPSCHLLRNVRPVSGVGYECSRFSANMQPPLQFGKPCYKILDKKKRGLLNGFLAVFGVRAGARWF